MRIILSRKHILLCLLQVGFFPDHSLAFLPQGGLVGTGHQLKNINRAPSTFLQYKGEKNIREELSQKNEIEDEEKYAVTESVAIMTTENESADENSEETSADKVTEISKQTEEAPTDTKVKTEPTALQKKLDRVSKQRAYPLFLMETACNIIEDIGKSIEKSLFDSDYEFSTLSKTKKKRIVVLGTGWGAAAFLKGIDADKYDVTVISPRNFFLFTPMLAGASVGSVDFRSITEPVRDINVKVEFLEATATDIDPKTQTINCDSVYCAGNSCEIKSFSVDYDYIIYTVGAQTNTFGIKGVREYCCFLKQVDDARRVRTAIINCFERASLPNLTDEERNAILTFAVIGAGPTGIEFASELRDFVEQDGPKYYPNLLQHVRIKIIEASSTVLAPFDKSLQSAAIKQLTRSVTVKKPEVRNLLPANFELTELLLDSGVSEVKENVICLNDGREIPYGLSVWAAGNGPLPITLQTIEALQSISDEQANAQSIARGRIAVDPWHRALGGEGKILALGDCSVNIDNQLPATAQVASQQGEHLARMFSKCDMEPKISTDEDGEEEGILLPPKKDLKDRKESLAEIISGFAINDSEVAAPFQFLNLGILAYTGGGSALAQLQVAPGEKGSVKGKGKIGFGLWRSVYLSKQVSWRNRVLVATDWVKAICFGRDITRLS